MYIIAIAWGFVVILMAAAEAMSTSVTGGLLTLLFYGLLPLALVLYLMGTPQRRRNLLKKEQAERPPATETPTENPSENS